MYKLCNQNKHRPSFYEFIYCVCIIDFWVFAKLCFQTDLKLGIYAKQVFLEKIFLSLTIVVEVSDDCHKYLACSGEHILRNCFSLNFCKNNIHSLSLTKVHYFSMSPISREANTKTFFTKYTFFTNWVDQTLYTYVM